MIKILKSSNDKLKEQVNSLQMSPLAKLPYEMHCSLHLTPKLSYDLMNMNLKVWLWVYSNFENMHFSPFRRPQRLPVPLANSSRL